MNLQQITYAISLCHHQINPWEFLYVDIIKLFLGYLVLADRVVSFWTISCWVVKPNLSNNQTKSGSKMETKRGLKILPKKRRPEASKSSLTIRPSPYSHGPGAQCIQGPSEVWRDPPKVCYDPQVCYLSQQDFIKVHVLILHDRMALHDPEHDRKVLGRC